MESTFVKNEFTLLPFFFFEQMVTFTLEICLSNIQFKGIENKI
jgi:hypothetical protein